MERLDRKYAMTGLGYAMLGMALGIYMAITKNTSTMGAHAHMLLVGFVVSFVYAVCYKLWINDTLSILPRIQFWAHQAGSALMAIGLLALYGGFAPEAAMGPVLGVGSLAVFAGMVVMKAVFIRAGRGVRGL